jgi:hypothetical protein
MGLSSQKEVDIGPKTPPGLSISILIRWEQPWWRRSVLSSRKPLQPRMNPGYHEPPVTIGSRPWIFETDPEIYNLILARSPTGAYTTLAVAV